MKNCILFLWCLWKQVYKFLICIPISQESQREGGVNKNHPLDRQQLLKGGERASRQQKDVAQERWGEFGERGSVEPQSPAPTPCSFWIRLPGPLTPLLPCGLRLSFSRESGGDCCWKDQVPLVYRCTLFVLSVSLILFILNQIFKVHQLLLPQHVVWLIAWILEALKAWCLTQVRYLPAVWPQGAAQSPSLPFRSVTEGADSLRPEGCCGPDQRGCQAEGLARRKRS